MNRRFSDSSLASDERGISLLIICAAAVTLLAVVGLAVDAGNLFLARQRLQRATDAAVTRGLALLGEIDDSAVETNAQQLAIDNLEQDLVRMSVTNWNPATAVDVRVVSGRPTKIVATGMLDIRTFIVGMIPGIQSVQAVASSSEGVRNEVVVALVLDNSDSMNCPADDRPCRSSGFDCMRTPSLARCRPSKIDELKNAAMSFVQLFDARTDHLSVVTFNSTAQVIPFADFDDLVLEQFRGIFADQFTNIGDGLETATSEIVNAPVSSSAHRVIVLVSDGAPTRGEKICSTGTQGYYLRAIDASDSARANDITVHAIGLGTDNGVTGDPYQNVRDSTSLKPFLLRRVANDPSGASDPAQFPESCVPSFSTISSGKTGIYLQTPNAQDLGQLLNMIGQTIKARLTK